VANRSLNKIKKIKWGKSNWKNGSFYIFMFSYD